MYTFIEPSVTLVEEDNLEKKVERCYRICYKSENKMQEQPGEFLRTIVNQKTNTPHWSPLEHARISLLTNEFIMNVLKKWEYDRGTKFLTIAPRDMNQYEITGNFRTFKEFITDQSNPNETIYAQYRVSRTLNSAYPCIFTEEEMANLAKKERNTEVVRPKVKWYKKLFNSDPDNEIECILSHESVYYATFHIITTRDILQELARHRSMSFSVESTRYCNYNKKGIAFTLPRPYLWSRGLDSDNPADIDSPIAKLYLEALEATSNIYEKLLEAGAKPQEARMVLPGALKTELMMTGTFAAWNHFLNLRNSSAAHPQIRLIAEKIDDIFKSKKIVLN